MKLFRPHVLIPQVWQSAADETVSPRSPAPGVEEPSPVMQLLMLMTFRDALLESYGSVPAAVAAAVTVAQLL